MREVVFVKAVSGVILLNVGVIFGFAVALS